MIHFLDPPKFWGSQKFLRVSERFWNFGAHFWNFWKFGQICPILQICLYFRHGVGGPQLFWRLAYDRRYFRPVRNFGQKFLQGPEISAWKSKKIQKWPIFSLLGGGRNLCRMAEISAKIWNFNTSLKCGRLLLGSLRSIWRYENLNFFSRKCVF